jgi:L-ascorbate metabolism protein UlaG (beta-lactamase superfamily)
VRLTRWGHACVTLDSGRGRLVLDLGEWSDAAALTGADAVLVTHHHPDHADADRLALAGLPVAGPAGGALGAATGFTALAVGDDLEVAGFEVSAVGGAHAAVFEGEQVCANLGYLVRAGGVTAYHPGDALHVPDEPVDLVLVPMQAPWLKTAEAMAFLRTVAAPAAIGVHDAQLNDLGRRSANRWLAAASDGYHWLEPGSGIDL